MTPASPPEPSARDLDLIGRTFSIGAIQSVSHLATGLMNRNWKITAEAGAFALKQIIDVAPDLARRNLRIVRQVRDHGLPVSSPVLTSTADPVLEVDDRSYCLLPWVDGDHLAGEDLTQPQVTELGTTTGRLHQLLNGPAVVALPEITARPRARTVQPDEAITQARRFHAAATAVGGPFDRRVIELLDQRIALIDKHAADRPTDDEPRGPYGWTHGDLQYRNLLWYEGHLNAVLDWDRIRNRPYSEEIVRTATIQFGTAGVLDLSRVSAFAASYRTIVPITVEDLADGVHRLWWKRVSDFWHLVFHYDRHDHSCDDLYFSGETLLHWWTDHHADVQGAFAA